MLKGSPFLRAEPHTGGQRPQWPRSRSSSNRNVRPGSKHSSTIAVSCVAGHGRISAVSRSVGSVSASLRSRARFQASPRPAGKPMTMSDPIADMLTRIRNASLARHSSCEMPFSKMKVSIAEVLRDEGYIDTFEERGEGITKVLRVHLRWASSASASPACASMRVRRRSRGSSVVSGPRSFRRLKAS